MIISSFFEGRVRLKSDIFKDNILTEKIKELLELSKVVTNIEINQVTGSMLLEYNPIKLPILKFQKAMPYLEKVQALYDEKGRDALTEIEENLSEVKKILIK